MSRPGLPGMFTGRFAGRARSVVVVFCALAGAMPTAQLSRPWSFDALMRQADGVVVGEVVETRASGEKGSIRELESPVPDALLLLMTTAIVALNARVAIASRTACSVVPSPDAMTASRVSGSVVAARPRSDNGPFCCPDPPSLILTIARLRRHPPSVMRS
jgi:hypothetical protein